MYGMYGKLQPFNRSWISVQMICRRASMTISNVWCSFLRIHWTCNPKSQAYLAPPPLELLWPLRLNVRCALFGRALLCRSDLLRTVISGGLSNQNPQHTVVNLSITYCEWNILNGSWYDSCIFWGLHPMVHGCCTRVPHVSTVKMFLENLVSCASTSRAGTCELMMHCMPKTRRSNRQFPTMRRHKNTNNPKALVSDTASGLCAVFVSNHWKPYSSPAVKIRLCFAKSCGVASPGFPRSQNGGHIWTVHPSRAPFIPIRDRRSWRCVKKTCPVQFCDQVGVLEAPGHLHEDSWFWHCTESQWFNSTKPITKNPHQGIVTTIYCIRPRSATHVGIMIRNPKPRAQTGGTFRILSILNHWFLSPGSEAWHPWSFHQNTQSKKFQIVLLQPQSLAFQPTCSASWLCS